MRNIFLLLILSIACEAQQLVYPAIRFKGCSDPTSISNLVVRFRANKNVSKSGNSVIGWTDEISGINCVQATGALQPQFVSNSLNGYPSIQFTSQYLVAAGQISSLEGQTQMTVYMLSAGTTPGAYSSVAAGIVSYQSKDAVSTYSVSLMGHTTHSDLYFSCNGSNVNNSVKSLENNWTVKGLKITGSNATIYENGISKKVAGSIATTFSSQANPEFTIGAYSLTGTYSTFDGSIVEILIFNRALTTAEHFQVTDYFFRTYGLQRKRLICDGNSLTFGTNSTGGNNYPQQLANSLGSSWLVYNVGVQGETTTTMASDATSKIDPIIGNQYFSKDVVLAWEGTNSIYFGLDATTSYNQMVSYCLARKQAGAKVIVATILSRSNSGTPGDFNTSRATYNTLIRNNWQYFADAILDLAANSNIGPDGAETNLTYFSNDLVHLNNTGYALVASLALTVVQTF